MNHPLSYVVVSTPRSATAYTARVLSRLGFRCGHEKYFLPFRVEAGHMKYGLLGDASWLAMPFIGGLAPGTLVLHQLRDPVRTINSINSGARYFGRPPDRLPDNNRSPYRYFIAKHTQGWHWPDTEAERGAHFWSEWHRRIETEVERRGDLLYFQYRVESLDARLLNLIAGLICRARGEGRGPGRDKASSALASVSRKHNHRSEVLESVNWDTLPDAARDMAIKYGYGRNA